MEMEQRLFLDGIYMLADRAPVYQRIKGAILIFAHQAKPLAALADQALVCTEMTPNPLVLFLLIKQGLFHGESP